jgi:hypothetical protein
VSPRAGRGRAWWPWTTLLIGSLGITAGLLWEFWPLLGAASVLRARGPIARTTAAEPPPQRRLHLVLPGAQDGAAREREVDVPRRPLLRSEVQGAVAALQREAALPAGLEVRHAFLDAFGILYVDFGAGFGEWLAANPAEAARGLQAAVATLATSFEGVSRVQFLAEGQAVRGTAGGLELERPVLPARDSGAAAVPLAGEDGAAPR